MSQHCAPGWCLGLVVLILCAHLAAQTVTLNIPAQAGYDNTVITSFVDGSGNPNFLSGSGSTLTVRGTTTPLTLMIAGTYQQLVSDTTVTVTNGSGASEVQFVYAMQDVSNATLQPTDFATTTLPPVYSYSAPTGATGQFWFDLSTDLMKSWNGASFVATPAVFLGEIDVTTTPTIDAALSEPYRLNPYRRVELFGTGADGARQLVNAGTVAIDGWFQYTVFDANKAGGSTVVQPTTWTSINPSVGTIVFSQNPVLIINGASVNANGKGRAAGTGGTSALPVGVSGGAGGCAGSGGGGGFANSSNGGSGGTRGAWGAPIAPIGAGANGTSGSHNGGVGQNETVLGTPHLREVMSVACIGAGGGGGASDGTNNGGAGGTGGGVVIIRAPSILVDAFPSIVAADGNAGSPGSAGNAGGGGGGGGGTALLQAIFVNQNGTLEANKGLHGAAAGTGGAGGDGGNGAAAVVRLQ